jgi:hypothetical protein
VVTGQFANFSIGIAFAGIYRLSFNKQGRALPLMQTLRQQKALHMYTKAYRKRQVIGVIRYMVEIMAIAFFSVVFFLLFVFFILSSQP